MATSRWRSRSVAARRTSTSARTSGSAMLSTRCSVRSSAGDRTRVRPAARPGVMARASAAAGVLVALLLTASDVSAQEPVLRIGEDALVRGTMVDGAAAYPARTLERLGFRVADAASGLIAVLDGDTLHFWNTSPYFRSGRSVHQLAFAAADVAGAMHLPEQFFIQWLPVTWPERFEYRSGVLLQRRGAVATVARATQPAPTKPAPAKSAPA